MRPFAVNFPQNVMAASGSISGGTIGVPSGSLLNDSK